MTNLRASATVASETIDGESIVIDLATGAYYSFQGWTAWAWQSLCAGVDTSDVDAALVEVGGASEFVERLVAAQMLIDRGADPVDPAPDFPPGAAESLIVERFDDMADMIMLDPVHDVDRAAGWPRPHDA